jgi:hypothetical protein
MPMDQHIPSTLEIDPPLDSHHEKHQNVLPQTQHEVEVEEERGNYAQGLQLLLICIPLCLCVFLVGLVSEQSGLVVQTNGDSTNHISDPFFRMQLFWQRLYQVLPMSLAPCRTSAGMTPLFDSHPACHSSLKGSSTITTPSNGSSCSVW